MGSIAALFLSQKPTVSVTESPTQKVHIIIETERLRLDPVSTEDQSDYISLYGDSMVMEKFATGKSKEEKYVKDTIARWSKQWSEGDPFSGFCVREKNTNAFIGHIILGHGENPGQSELAFLFRKEYWSQGYGKEAVAAVLENLAPELMHRGFLLKGNPLEEIVATSRTDNIAANKILKQFMGEVAAQNEKFGCMRNLYSLKTKDIAITTDSTWHITSVFQKICFFFVAA